jgi:hypothetical protein
MGDHSMVVEQSEILIGGIEDADKRIKKKRKKRLKKKKNSSPSINY